MLPDRGAPWRSPGHAAAGSAPRGPGALALPAASESEEPGEGEAPPLSAARLRRVWPVAAAAALAALAAAAAALAPAAAAQARRGAPAAASPEAAVRAVAAAGAPLEADAPEVAPPGADGSPEAQPSEADPREEADPLEADDLQEAHAASNRSQAPAPTSCVVYGNEHVEFFGGENNINGSFHKIGEHWIVKSGAVQIQATTGFLNNVADLIVVKELALASPFWDGQALHFTATEASWHSGHKDVEIIPGFPDAWSNEDNSIQVVADSTGQLLQPDRWNLPFHCVHLRLPLGVHMQINRWSDPAEGFFLDFRVTMSAEPGQEGQCSGPSDTEVSDEDSLFALFAPHAEMSPHAHTMQASSHESGSDALFTVPHADVVLLFLLFLFLLLLLHLLVV